MVLLKGFLVFYSCDSVTVTVSLKLTSFTMLCSNLIVQYYIVVYLTYIVRCV